MRTRRKMTCLNQDAGRLFGFTFPIRPIPPTHCGIPRLEPLTTLSIDRMIITIKLAARAF